MNKKIISIFFLLIILVSIAVAYSYFNQISSDENENQYSSSPNTVTDSDVAGEIDNSFLEENDEVEIGEMV